MPPWNSLKPPKGHFVGVSGTLNLADRKIALVDRAETSQWAVASVRGSGDPFKTTTGEKIYFGVFLLIGLVGAFLLVLLAALGLYGYTRKLLAQLFLWGLFWVAVLFVFVFIAKTFWKWLP